MRSTNSSLIFDRPLASVQLDASVHSFVQVRGSIPLFWHHPSHRRYRPPLHMDNDKARTIKALQAHVNRLMGTYVLQLTPDQDTKYGNTATSDGVHYYKYRQLAQEGNMDSRSSGGSVVFINLIDKTKEQGQLGQLLRTSLATLAQQMDQQHESSSSNASRGDKNILEGIDISSLKEPTNRKASNNDIVGTKRLKTVLGVEQRDDLRKTDTADADSPDPTIIVGEGRGAHGGHNFMAPSPTLSPRR